MLKLNKDTLPEEDFLTEDDIRKYLKSLIVGENQEPPIRMFYCIVHETIDSDNIIRLNIVANAYSRMENGNIIRDYYSEGMVKKFMDISEKYGGILKLV